MSFTTVKTSMTQAFPGMHNGLNKNRTKPALSEEVSAQIRFGLAVVQGTSDDGVKIPAAQTDVIVGLVPQSHALARDPGTGVGELGDTGLLPGAVFDLDEEGELWVLTDEAVTPTSAVRVRMSGGSAGYFRATSAAGVTVDVSDRCRWAGSYGSGYALLKFDFRRRKAGTAD